jgi:hypothetical protein
MPVDYHEGPPNHISGDIRKALKHMSRKRLLMKWADSKSQGTVACEHGTELLDFCQDFAPDLSPDDMKFSLLALTQTLPLRYNVARGREESGILGRCPLCTTTARADTAHIFSCPWTRSKVQQLCSTAATWLCNLGHVRENSRAPEEVAAMAWVDSVPTLQVQLTNQQKADVAVQFALNAPSSRRNARAFRSALRHSVAHHVSRNTAYVPDVLLRLLTTSLRLSNECFSSLLSRKTYFQYWHYTDQCDAG